MDREEILGKLLGRLTEPRRFLQVLAGPRQVGKTTLAQEVLRRIGTGSHYGTADEPALKDRAWIRSQWEIGRHKASAGVALLVLDEIQKIPGWSETVKALWDADTRQRVRLKVLLLGSSPLLIQGGLSESLAGRFEIIPAPHWSFGEVRRAFGRDLDQFLFFGGYPGAAPLVKEPERWRQYILDSLIETSISRDILVMTRVDKPALLRHLFRLACDYSGQVLSYQKMLGQLTDAGNTVTLAHYLRLLEGAGMVGGLPKFSGSKIRQRGSSPKLQVLNTALMTASSGDSFEEWRRDSQRWGRLVESAVGARLYNSSLGTPIEVSYWRERNREVDFVLRRGKALIAIEVKSGTRETSRGGLGAFAQLFKPRRSLVVGGEGLPLAEFLSEPAARWFD